MKYQNKATQCVHSGKVGDEKYKGVNSPVYTSSAYNYIDREHLYPRYFNTPNQKAVVQKICELEQAEDGLLFSSGMAAISTTMMGLLQKGDHVIFQNELYGGTKHFIFNEFIKFGVEFSFASSNELTDFEQLIRPQTRIIYVETPSNPLLTLIDLEEISRLAKKHHLLTLIDNTFASPINQNPLLQGIDVVLHSATKYIGGHSDICAGLAVSSREIIKKISKSAWNFGGSPDNQMAYLLERSLKTLHLRVKCQNENAMYLAGQLSVHPLVEKVFYPGLESHPGHLIAKKQMTGFGGMLSFRLQPEIDPVRFTQSLQLLTPAMSLGGVETTLTQPSQTSHSKITQAERDALGISDHLMRLSVGIEDAGELWNDLVQAIKKSYVAEAVSN